MTTVEKDATADTRRPMLSRRCDSVLERRDGVRASVRPREVGCEFAPTEQAPRGDAVAVAMTLIVQGIGAVGGSIVAAARTPPVPGNAENCPTARSLEEGGALSKCD